MSSDDEIKSEEIETEEADNGEEEGAKRNKAKPPKPRKHALLWQAYQHWDELMKMRARHDQRLKFIDQGKSNLNRAVEETIARGLDKPIEEAVEEMVEQGVLVGPVWGWLTGMKGLGRGSLAAQLLAQIDDVMLFPTISKLWRFSGYAVFDGKAERSSEKEKRHYNGRLKSTVWLIVDEFAKHHVSPWDDLYQEHQVRLRMLHPDKVKIDGKTRYNDSHIRKMARRRVAKEFLKQLWLVWRAQEQEASKSVEPTMSMPPA